MCACAHRGVTACASFLTDRSIDRSIDRFIDRSIGSSTDPIPIPKQTQAAAGGLSIEIVSYHIIGRPPSPTPQHLLNMRLYTHPTTSSSTHTLTHTGPMMMTTQLQEQQQQHQQRQQQRPRAAGPLLLLLLLLSLQQPAQAFWHGHPSCALGKRIVPQSSIFPRHHHQQQPGR